MQFFIHEVSQYRFAGNPEGVVMNMYHMLPRLFPTQKAAQAYADLSFFKDAKVEVHRK